ncbi:hypothetical protein M9Y10_015933 [Tritrichomonas musculus]|uniref:Right handed beta helix domain-containing protein n=1 Tax=Tritrichomonas musculus TaxID=1915356 RepID=A0ABR2I4X8_9EUKA
MNSDRMSFCGGITDIENSESTLYRCILENNSINLVSNNPYYIQGGLIYSDSSEENLIKCTFNNTSICYNDNIGSIFNGGMLYAKSTVCTVINCEFISFFLNKVDKSQNTIKGLQVYLDGSRGIF